jgi:hypothetical protein
LNFGDYRLYNAYIVTFNHFNQLYLDNFMIGDYFTIPLEISSLFTDPVHTYSDIDDVDVIEMRFPNGFLEKQYGLTPDMNIPKDIVFEYYIGSEHLNVTKPSKNRGFTIETKEKGTHLVQYIKREYAQL